MISFKGIEDIGRAREYYQKGIQACADNAILWKLAIQLEASARGAPKARSMAEMARMKLPLSEEIWLESIRLERNAGNLKLAESLMAKALRDCPNSGILWAEEVLTCPKPAQKQK
jgi:pre-mRNA-processing factor 6